MKITQTIPSVGEKKKERKSYSCLVAKNCANNFPICAGTRPNHFYMCVPFFTDIRKKAGLY